MTTTVRVEPGFEADGPFVPVNAVGGPRHYDNSGVTSHPVEDCDRDKCGFPAGGGLGGQLVATICVDFAAPQGA